jgi:hypothetical protein
MSENQQTDLSDVPNDLIEIHDPQINVEEIMVHIRETMAQRRRELGYEQINFLYYGGFVIPDRPDDIPYDANLYYHLEIANKMYTEVSTEPVLVPSPATLVPIVGRLWQFIRYQAHNLVLFYVNRSIQQQVNLHRHLLYVLNLLTAENQKQQHEILKLKDKLAHLRSQLDEEK